MEHRAHIKINSFTIINIKHTKKFFGVLKNFGSMQKKFFCLPCSSGGIHENLPLWNLKFSNHEKDAF
jgi:hypothetical protein